MSKLSDGLYLVRKIKGESKNENDDKIFTLGDWEESKALMLEKSGKVDCW